VVYGGGDVGLMDEMAEVGFVRAADRESLIVAPDAGSLLTAVADFVPPGRSTTPRPKASSHKDPNGTEGPHPPTVPGGAVSGDTGVGASRRATGSFGIHPRVRRCAFLPH
jgi:hypothetical protein